MKSDRSGQVLYKYILNKKSHLNIRYGAGGVNSSTRSRFFRQDFGTKIMETSPGLRLKRFDTWIFLNTLIFLLISNICNLCAYINFNQHQAGQSDKIKFVGNIVGIKFQGSITSSTHISLVIKSAPHQCLVVHAEQLNCQNVLMKILQNIVYFFANCANLCNCLPLS